MVPFTVSLTKKKRKKTNKQKQNKTKQTFANVKFPSVTGVSKLR